MPPELTPQPVQAPGVTGSGSINRLAGGISYWDKEDLGRRSVDGQEEISSPVLSYVKFELVLSHQSLDFEFRKSWLGLF